MERIKRTCIWSGFIHSTNLKSRMIKHTVGTIILNCNLCWSLFDMRLKKILFI